ncbi:MAG TPA: hypothetical protein VLX59_01845 [Acidimicrobiales bacterium]|nr:hypothetical protein [Acidimicrobiales bacterium]
MAWIEKRKSSTGATWRVSWWASVPGGGRAIRHSKPFLTEAQARNHRVKVETDGRKGLSTDYGGAEQLFADYVRAWLDSRLVKGRPLAPRTRYEYEGLLRRNILPIFGSTRLRAIGTSDVRTRAGRSDRPSRQRPGRQVLSDAPGRAQHRGRR